MPRRGKNQSKEASILQAAAELFTEQDFHQVLMEDVAVRAQVGKGTLYRYFPTKEALYFATIFAGWDRLREELEGVVREEEPVGELLEKTARQILTYFWQRRHFATLVYRLEHKASGQEKRDWQRRREGIVRLVEGVVKRGMLSDGLLVGDVRMLTELFLGMVRAAILYRGSRDTPEALAGFIASLFLEGIRSQRLTTPHTQTLLGGKTRDRAAALL
ncbi:MAG: TetR/AcrR family transcriptional regulator [Deltaproteobacteria bacterium]|nr:TetR/AcrR family transcriptional regulator [Deltaproteobacteria bacterium]